MLSLSKPLNPDFNFLAFSFALARPSLKSSAGGIDPKILELFNKASDSYLSSLDKVEMKATKIRDRIMEWLGFTKEINEETGDISFKFERITGGTVSVLYWF